MAAPSTSPYPTLRDRKAARAAALAAAVPALLARLRIEARAAGGRYLLYGSLARGTPGPGSDADLLLDFPGTAEAAAWRAAEAACWDLGVAPDIRPLAWCSDAFRAAVLPTAVVLA